MTADALDTAPTRVGAVNALYAARAVRAFADGFAVIVLPAYLSAIGLTELIAGSLEEYVQVAARWARDTTRLAQIRRGLRQRMNGSPLCDGERCAARVILVLRYALREVRPRSV